MTKGFWLAALFAVAACTQKPVTTSNRESVAMNDLCPLYTSGATIPFARVDGGGALTFTAGPSSVHALRSRTRRVVAMHNERLDTSTATPDPIDPISAEPQRMPNAMASVADVPGGARVVLVPTKPGELESLRNQMQTHLGRMSRVECPELWRETASAEDPSALQ